MLVKVQVASVRHFTILQYMYLVSCKHMHRISAAVGTVTVISDSCMRRWNFKCQLTVITYFGAIATIMHGAGTCDMLLA